MPLVSVVVPVHNRADVVGDAIASLMQQSFGDFEVIVVDDGSTDQSAEIALRSGDGRVRLVRHERNLGIPAARNSGLDAATGAFIAWLDSDDLARPGRLAEQVRFLSAHPDTAALGACSGRVDWQGRPKGRPRVPLFTHEALVPALMFRTPMIQSTLMGRAEILQSCRYRSEYPVCEDLDMYIRLTRSHRIANLPFIAVDRRLHPNQVTETRAALVRDRKRTLVGDQLGHLGIDPTADDLDRHITLGRPKGGELPSDFLPWAEHWLRGLSQANQLANVYDAAGLEFTCATMWLLACRAVAGRQRDEGLRRLLRSPLARGYLNREGRGWLRNAASVFCGQALNWNARRAPELRRTVKG